MNDFEMKMKDNITVETISKAIINETSKWGFKHSDYITLVNGLLDLSILKSNQEESQVVVKEKPVRTKHDFPLHGKDIQVRLFNKNKDYKLVQDWLKDDTSRWFLLSRSSSRDKTVQQIFEDERNIFGIIMLPDKTPIGLMAFLNNDQVNHKAEMRKLIGEEIHREKGYAKEATKLWIEYGINNLGLKNIS